MGRYERYLRQIRDRVKARAGEIVGELQRSETRTLNDLDRFVRESRIKHRH